MAPREMVSSEWRVPVGQKNVQSCDATWQERDPNVTRSCDGNGGRSGDNLRRKARAESRADGRLKTGLDGRGGCGAKKAVSASSVGQPLK